MQTRGRRQPCTRADFLQWEASQAERYEYVGGVVRLMAGGTVDHNLIAGNIFAALHGRLGGTPCTPFQQNMQLTPTENEDATYPDIVVVCRPIEGGAVALSTATVVIEVSSPSTKQDDIDRKWQGYQLIVDLRHYAVVGQDALEIQLYSRSDAGEVWEYRRIVGANGDLDLTAIGVSLSFSEIFAGTRAVRAAD